MNARVEGLTSDFASLRSRLRSDGGAAPDARRDAELLRADFDRLTASVRERHVDIHRTTSKLLEDFDARLKRMEAANGGVGSDLAALRELADESVRGLQAMSRSTGESVGELDERVGGVEDRVGALEREVVERKESSDKLMVGVLRKIEEVVREQTGGTSTVMVGGCVLKDLLWEEVEEKLKDMDERYERLFKDLSAIVRHFSTANPPTVRIKAPLF
jgi:hypothetical protein